MRLRPLGCKNPGTCTGALAAVKNPSPQVFESQVFGLLGPNGADKTTSINMIGVCPQNMVLWNTLHKVLTLDNFTRECYIPATDRRVNA